MSGAYLLLFEVGIPNLECDTSWSLPYQIWVTVTLTPLNGNFFRIWLCWIWNQREWNVQHTSKYPPYTHPWPLSGVKPLLWKWLCCKENERINNMQAMILSLHTSSTPRLQDFISTETSTMWAVRTFILAFKWPKWRQNITYDFDPNCMLLKSWFWKKIRCGNNLMSSNFILQTSIRYNHVLHGDRANSKPLQSLAKRVKTQECHSIKWFRANKTIAHPILLNSKLSSVIDAWNSLIWSINRPSYFICWTCQIRMFLGPTLPLLTSSERADARVHPRPIQLIEACLNCLPRSKRRPNGVITVGNVPDTLRYRKNPRMTLLAKVLGPQIQTVRDRGIRPWIWPRPIWTHPVRP